jgi:hypothetical protein
MEANISQAGVWLEHNTSYWSTVVAVNQGHLRLSNRSVSSGFLCDRTDPVVGEVTAAQPTSPAAAEEILSYFPSLILDLD